MTSFAVDNSLSFVFPINVWIVIAATTPIMARVTKTSAKVNATLNLGLFGYAQLKHSFSELLCNSSTPASCLHSRARSHSLDSALPKIRSARVKATLHLKVNAFSSSTDGERMSEGQVRG